ncbi:cadherin-like domain-containing protein, partial [Oleiphilus sp. HI0080]
VTVRGLNAAPVAVDDSGLSVDVGQDLIINSADLLANDTDPDNGAVLTVVGFETPSQGSIVDNGDGTFTFSTPQNLSMAQGESYVSSLTYTVEDELGASSSASFSVTVNGVNDGPVAGAYNVLNSGEADVVTIDVADLLGLVSDPD